MILEQPTTPLPDTWPKRMAMLSKRYIFWPLLTGLHVAMSVVVLFVLLVLIVPDFFRSRKSKPLTYPQPVRRKRSIPIREGSDIFELMPDGTKVPVEALDAKLTAEAWSAVVMGAYVYEKTKLPD